MAGKTDAPMSFDPSTYDAFAINMTALDATKRFEFEYGILAMLNESYSEASDSLPNDTGGTSPRNEHAALFPEWILGEEFGLDTTM